MPQPRNWSYNRNYGKVKRIYETQTSTARRTYFMLTDGETAMNPADGYYYISASHKNFGGLKSLLYMAARDRRRIHARTKQNLNGEGHAEVVYLVMDW